MGKKENHAGRITLQSNQTEGESVDFYVLEQTRIGGRTYVLVTEEKEGDTEALILKDLSEDGEEDAIYTIVDQEDELKAVSEVFQSMLEDVTIED